MLGVSPASQPKTEMRMGKKPSSEKSNRIFQIAYHFSPVPFPFACNVVVSHTARKQFQIWIKCFMININNGIAVALANSSHTCARARDNEMNAKVEKASSSSPIESNTVISRLFFRETVTLRMLLQICINEANGSNRKKPPHHRDVMSLVYPLPNFISSRVPKVNCCRQFRSNASENVSKERKK